MNDMSSVIIAKSDQLNGDDLISGPITITITNVTIRPGTEQPVSILYDGDGGKPYKCCKSMARVMVQCWGPDANKYVGKSMTLYRDPNVLWGGMAVGGIRISHMTDINGAQTMALTATKGSKKLFTVKPLASAPTPTQPTEPAQKGPTVGAWLAELQIELDAAMTTEAVDAIVYRPNVQAALTKLKNGALVRLKAMIDAAVARTAPPDTSADAPEDEGDGSAEDDGWPGPDLPAKDAA